jgi:uroporphyrinogen decarboxylase
MSDVTNSLFMRAIKQQPVERTPIWLMRQAGRYLPEYRQTRAKAGDFLSLCKNKELACEVTLQPLARYNLDAAIIFSDILTIPDAMGLGLSFAEGEGPKFARPIRDITAIDKLVIPDVEHDLDYVFAAASLIRKEMPKNLPLIGFSGSPWTLACYMIEGEGSKDFKRTLKFMYNNLIAMHNLLLKLCDTVSLYLSNQVKAGVNALMIFDTWGGILNTQNYQDFSLQYMQKIVRDVKIKHPEIPIILFTKGGGNWLELIANTGCDVVGLDWTCDLSRARDAIGHKVALQGNLDPVVLLTSKESICRETERVLNAFGGKTGHIFNLGHGITPDVPPDNVKILIDKVHDFSEKMLLSPN